MTLQMPDSIRPWELPPGFPAYLGYVDGHWPTAADLFKRFPDAWRVLLTVNGGTLAAHGIDCEPGNVNAADTRVWVQRKLAADPGSRPVIYASVIGQPNYGMPWVLDALQRNGIGRAQVRLLSAHYGQGPHICGPDTCKAIGTPMDGTQWTDAWDTGTADVDMSELRDDFFGPVTETERLVRELPVVRQGDSGEAVRTVQGLCCSRGADVNIDGVFGPNTKGAVAWVQQNRGGFLGSQVDGVVGPLTWPVMLGIAP